LSWKDLLDHRLLFVTGKGGTGKTSLSAAIGLRCAAEGRRTVVVEIENHAPTLPSVLGVRPSYQPQFAAPNLAVCNLTWDHALEDWLALNLPIERVRHLVLSNRIVQTFLVATPGAQETVILSKIVALLEGWDTVVVDLPASGHALGLLRVPAITIRMVRSGPIRARALAILGRLRSKDVAILLVAMPEDMIVTETLETAERFQREVPEIAIAAVILNRSSLPTFTESERILLERLSSAKDPRAEDAELLLAGRWEESLEHATREALERLTPIGAPIYDFPRLGALGGFAGGPERVIQQMAAAVARKSLGVP
jgi:arsenite/tail-anchored protein-transporting ATPase